MSTFLSKKIRNILYLTMICVVFIHAYNYTDTFLQSTTKITEGTNIFAMIEFYISNGITRFAVPLFFMASALFLFRKFENNLKAYPKELSKRCKTILLPWIIFIAFWTIIGIILYNLPVIGNNFLLDEKCSGLFSPEIGIFQKIYNLIFNPLNFQYWYLYTLFILVVLSPIYYLFVKILKGFPLIILFGLWLFNISFILNVDGVFFFGVGAFIGVNSDKLEKYLIKYKSKLLTFVFCILAILITGVYTFLSASSKIETSDIFRNIMFKLVQLLSLVAIWRLCDSFGDLRENNAIVKLAPSSFVLFTFHEPIQHFVFGTVLSFTQSDLVHILIYFITPVVLIILSYYLDKLLRKAPKLHSALTGGR